MRSFLIAGVLFLGAATASAQPAEYAPPYDGIQAGLDSYAYGEAQRQDKINRQLNTNDQLAWWRGLPPSRESVLAYGYPPSLDYVYVTGRRGLFGRYRERVYYAPANIYTPWPYVPGDIWGSTNTSRVPQSIGQRQVQTGPNRWESHPVYDEPVRPAQAETVLPPEPVEVQRPSPAARDF